jgi:hypothetical protein
LTRGRGAASAIHHFKNKEISVGSQAQFRPTSLGLRRSTRAPLRERGGQIINISLQPILIPFMGIYSASKFA